MHNREFAASAESRAVFVEDCFFFLSRLLTFLAGFLAARCWTDFLNIACEDRTFDEQRSGTVLWLIINTVFDVAVVLRI